MKPDLSSRISHCRSCGAASLEPVLDLGSQPPANSLRRDPVATITSIPLEICRCSSCGTVQLTETVDPAFLFQRYVWVTGTSRTATEFSRTFCDRVRSRMGANRELFVVEVASNDGTFLRPFQDAGDRILGVDPARNVATAANAAGIPTRAEFFGRKTARRILEEQGPADVAFARNVLPHVADPMDILNGIADCLKDEGMAVVEFHQAEAILNELHYDSIYHEHLFLHSLASMEFLMRKAGLHPFDLAASPISGGSLVVFCSKEEREPSVTLKAQRAAEKCAGTNTADRWHEFARRSLAHRQRLRDVVKNEIAYGRRMIGYGASARSSTLLNFCGVNHRHLKAIADRSPYKHHHWTPGSDVQILPPAEALMLKPDVVLLLAWNFRDEILAELLQRGFSGRVILPLPGDPTVITV